MMNPADIRKLADYRAAADGPVLNVFLHRSVESGFKDHDAVHRKERLHELEKKLADGPLAPALRAAKAYLDTLPHAVKGVAAYFNAAGKVANFEIGAPFREAIEVGRRPFVRPLLAMADTRPTVCVVAVDLSHAKIMAYSPDGLSAVNDLAINIPRPATPPGTTGENHIQNHRRELSNHMAEDVADAVRQFDRERAPKMILLLGQEANTRRVTDHLPVRLARKCISHHGPARFDEKPAVYEKFVKPIIEKHFREQAQSRKARLRDLLKQGYHAIEDEQMVWDQVLAGNVVEIYFGTRDAAPGSVCTKCEMVFPNARKECPYCSTTCAPARFDEEVAAWAVRHDVPVHFLPPGEPDEPVLSVAAVLRHDVNGKAERA